MYSISCLCQHVQVSVVSLQGREPEAEPLCFTQAHGRAGVLDPFKNRNGQANTSTAAACHLSGRAQSTAFSRVRCGDKACRAATREPVPAPRLHWVPLDKIGFSQVFFFRCSPLFRLFGREGVCFLGTGLLPYCFLGSLSAAWLRERTLPHFVCVPRDS